MNSTPVCQARWPIGRKRDRGSILINTAVALSLIAITLVGTELGYLFYMKREFQKAVDLSALAGAQQLTPSATSSNCGAAIGAANTNAGQNLSGVAINPPECGSWEPSGPTGGNAGCFSSSTDHFKPDGTPSNAVRVRIEKAPPTLLPFFAGDRTICVQAVAVLDAPVAAFTVGSRLLRLEDNTLLPNLLKAVGVDLSPTDLLSYRGLANTSITPSGLLAALGVPINGDLDVGTLNQLASIQNLTLGGLIDATVIALQNQGGAVSTSIGLLQRLRTDLSVPALATKVKLFGNETTPGILVGLDQTGNSALNANVDVLSLVTAGASVANGKNLVALGSLGIAGLIEAKASVIEPPAIGIGAIGATAKTAQIRAYIRVKILGLLDLPLILELAQSTGQLKTINCQAPRHSATIAVSSSQANICLGRFHDMLSEADGESARFFTQNNRCTPDSSGEFPDSIDGVRRHRILDVLGVLGIGAVSAKARAGIAVAATNEPILTGTLYPPPDGPSQTTITSPGIDLASTVGNIVDAVVGDLKDQGLVGLLLSTVTDLLLTPLLNVLSDVLAALLSTLGLSLGQTDVSLLSIDCGVAKLVH